jgi:hypothetical protein
VPASAMARYGASHVLDLRDVSVNGGAMAARDDDGLHVAAYLADASGDGIYAQDDAQAILDAITGKYSGFGAYPLLDPVVVGGAYGNGRLSVFDFRALGNIIYGVAQPYIPALPVLPAMASTLDAQPDAPSEPPQPAAQETITADNAALVGEQASAVTSPQPALPTPPPVAETTPPMTEAAQRQPATMADTAAAQEPAADPYDPASQALDLPSMQAVSSGFVVPVLQEYRVAAPDFSALVSDPLARQDLAGVLSPADESQSGGQPPMRDGSTLAASDVRIRFDRHARIDEAQPTTSRSSAWLGQWVQGQDAHVPRKNADWRVVLPRV